MAFTVAVVVLKGGAGKTMTALALAEAAAESGAASTLVDADPMGGAVRQAALAEEAGRALRSTVIGLAASDLSKRMGSITPGADIVTMDGPPPGALKIAKAVMESADVVLMPCPARPGDLDRVPATLALAEEVGVPVFGAFNFYQRGTNNAVAAEALVESYGVTMLDTRLITSTKVAENYGLRPRGLMARYGRELLDELTRKAAE
ncbi:nucleotide-binding protein [Streptomyces sp. NPDC054975]